MNSQSRARRLFTVELPKYILVLACVVAVIIFASIQPKFLNTANIMSIFVTLSIGGVMAYAAMLPFGCGEVNFAVSSSASLAATVVGLLASRMPYGLAVLIGLAAGTLVGLLTALIAFRFKVPSLIASLGVAKIFDGLVMRMADNSTIMSNKWPASFKWLGQGKIGVVSVAPIVFVAITVLMVIVTDKTRYGRYLFAVGANPVACRQSGVKLIRTKTLTLVVSSLLAGFSGIMLASQVAQVSLLSGNSLMMNAIAAAMLGATCIRPGRYSIQGTFVAIILMSILQNGVICIGAPSQWRTLIQGIVFIFSVGLISMTRKGGLPAVSMT